MTPALKMNLCDSAIADASPRLLELLNMAGQDVSRGYRAVLAPLFDRHVTDWFGLENVIEKTIRVLNIVVFGADFQERLPDDKLADLCLYFIERMKFSK